MPLTQKLHWNMNLHWTKNECLSSFQKSAAHHWLDCVCQTLSLLICQAPVFFPKAFLNKVIYPAFMHRQRKMFRKQLDSKEMCKSDSSFIFHLQSQVSKTRLFPTTQGWHQLAVMFLSSTRSCIHTHACTLALSYLAVLNARCFV